LLSHAPISAGLKSYFFKQVAAQSVEPRQKEGLPLATNRYFQRLYTLGGELLETINFATTHGFMKRGTDRFTIIANLPSDLEAETTKKKWIGRLRLK